MSILDRIRRRHDEDTETEQVRRIRSSQRKAVTPADIEAIENEMVPWLARKRAERRRAIERGEIPPD